MITVIPGHACIRQTGAAALLSGLLALCPHPARADGLTIEQAGQIALASDETLRAYEQRSRSMLELSEAATALPDPQLRLGFANLPTDSFNLGQEPMTQSVIGIRQMFPRGQTRALSQQQMVLSAARIDAEAQDQQLNILRMVREEYARLYQHIEREKILADSRDVFADLAEIIGDYYATGRAHQQDVVAAQLELSKVQERQSREQQAQQESRNRLARWIGPAAERTLAAPWRQLNSVQAEADILAGLVSHPKIQAWQHEIERNETSSDLARQAYKPGFAADLAYGARGGVNPDGRNRSDMLSAFVSMDIPLFSRKRQDRALASSIAETSASRHAMEDLYRSLQARVRESYASLLHQRERLAMFEQALVPQAGFSAESAFEDYQDALGDLTTLLRARIGEYEIKLSQADLQADEMASRIKLLYLQGE